MRFDTQPYRQGVTVKRVVELPDHKVLVFDDGVEKAIAFEKETGAGFPVNVRGQHSFDFPLDQVTVTCPFGYDPEYTGNRLHFHGGIDFRARQPTPVYAVADGQVLWAAKTNFPKSKLLLNHPDAPPELGKNYRLRLQNFHVGSGCWGHYIQIYHRIGIHEVYSGYAHLSDIKVNPGDRVTRGDAIGKTGDTSSVQIPPHLHFQVLMRVSDKKWLRLNPTVFFPPL